MSPESPILRIREMMNGAGPHLSSHLAACIRALGGEARHSVMLSQTDPGSFRPPSAWPGMDRKRMSPRHGGHVDGEVDLLITGRVLMEDSLLAANPRFLRLNGSFLMGEKRRDAMPVVYYDQLTGRFALVATVFAAYSLGEGQREEGPHQTGSALVEVVADRARPLRARFYDEMPDVEIILEYAGKADR